MVLNHILSSNIATIASAALTNSLPTYPAENLRPVRHSLTLLTEALRKLDSAAADVPASSALPTTAEAHAVKKQPVVSPDERLLLEQLEFIQKVSGDIRKVTDVVAA